MVSWSPGKPCPLIFWKRVQVYRKLFCPPVLFFDSYFESVWEMILGLGIMRMWTGSHNVETGHSDLYSMMSLFFKEQKNPIIYHVLVGLLSYRLLEFELQSYGVNPAIVSGELPVWGWCHGSSSNLSFFTSASSSELSNPQSSKCWKKLPR